MSSALEVSSFLRAKTDLLFAAWGDEMLEVSCTATSSELALVDHLAQLVDELASALDAERDDFALEARRHRVLRHSRGITRSRVELEYAALRRAVHRAYREAGGGDSLAAFDDALEGALAEAVGAYLDDESAAPEEREGSRPQLSRRAPSAA